VWKSRFAEIVSSQRLSTERFAEASRLRKDNLPATLYKYRPFSAQSLGLLRARSVWLASPSSFNDPFDSAVIFDFRNVVKSIRAVKTDSANGKSLLVRLIQGEDLSLPPSVRDELVEGATSVYRGLFMPLIERATHQLRSCLRICCFSSRADNVPMWTHYADNLTGFCIGWNLSNWCDRAELINGLFPVLYDIQPFEMPWLVLNPPFDGAEVLLALRKASDWSYEEEWRLIERTTDGQSGRLIGLPNPDVVYVGPLMPVENRRELWGICQTMGIAVVETRIDLDRGRLVPDDRRK
jgi:hypothetical protein